jgi:hypothetical protein
MRRQTTSTTSQEELHAIVKELAGKSDAEVAAFIRSRFRESDATVASA